MWSLLNHPSNVVFSIALGVMLFLGIVELLSLLMGGLSDWLDGLLPEGLNGDMHTDIHLDAGSTSIIKLLSWLYVGKIPVLIWLTVFLGVFGASGLIVQNTLHAFTELYLPVWMASMGMLFLCLPLVRMVAAGVYRIMPKDETTAINHEDLIGRVAQIVLGDAKLGAAAEAKVVDRFGQTHYIMVEPDAEDILVQGSMVLLVSQQASGFKAIKNPHQDLM